MAATADANNSKALATSGAAKANPSSNTSKAQSQAVESNIMASSTEPERASPPAMPPIILTEEEFEAMFKKTLIHARVGKRDFVSDASTIEGVLRIALSRGRIEYTAEELIAAEQTQRNIEEIRYELGQAVRRSKLAELAWKLVRLERRLGI